MAVCDPAGQHCGVEAAEDVGGVTELGMVLAANPLRNHRWLRKALRL